MVSVPQRPQYTESRKGKMGKSEHRRGQDRSREKNKRNGGGGGQQLFLKETNTFREVSVRAVTLGRPGSPL
jgi:hypothetical protein